MGSLSNKVALVTGASRGIGRATAKSLADAGARVLVHYGSASAEAEALVAELLRRAVFIRKPGAPPLERYVRVTIGNADERAQFAAVLPEAIAAVDAGAAVAGPA